MVKPVLLAAHHQPGDLRLIHQELTGWYARNYEIICTDSPASAQPGLTTEVTHKTAKPLTPLQGHHSMRAPRGAAAPAARHDSSTNELPAFPAPRRSRVHRNLVADPRSMPLQWPRTDLQVPGCCRSAAVTT
jgi:hypothetical protein